MKIDPNKCIGCGKCSIFCPMECILIKKRPTEMPGKSKRYSVTDEDNCVECRCCIRAEVCQSGALFQPPLEWPRTIRAAFSDPTITFAETGVPGRGTEEMKTNEVTNRYGQGMVGIALEIGRPGLGARLFDLEKMSTALSKVGAHFEPMNPVTSVLMEDPDKGKLRPEVLNEKVMSAIIEADIPLDKFDKAIKIIRQTSNSLESVFALDVICMPEDDGAEPIIPIIEKEGFQIRFNGKTNLGLGRHTNKKEKK